MNQTNQHQASNYLISPLVPLQNSKANCLVWVADDKNGVYRSLFQNMAMKDNLISDVATKMFPKGLPYDYSCPSVDAATIKKRSCSHCGMYFGSICRKNSHQAACKTVASPLEKQHVTARRIAARRQRKLLCVIEMQENEWLPSTKCI